MRVGLPVYDDIEYIPLSTLSQASYCLRRAALLLNEQVWIENTETAKGRAEHERVHTQRVERRGEHIKLFEYPVFSDSMHLNGKCDCVEADYSPEGCILPSLDFPVKLYPVEYKHGTVRKENEYEIQLCAQAMCLEEMYGTSITEGAIFYISSHERFPVKLDENLRQKVRKTMEVVSELRNGFLLPRATESAKCKRCSLNEYCMPKTKNSAIKYCEQIKNEAQGCEVI